jgi:septum formation protein
MTKIVLASKSPRRAHLFRQIGIDFSTHPSKVDETLDDNIAPEILAGNLAEVKADTVAKQYSESLVIAADTIVVINNRLLGKPENEDDAFKMLTLLSGKSHYVYTGVCVHHTDAESNISSSLKFTERTRVSFSELSKREIEHYIKCGSPFDKAGSYGIQDDMGSLFVEKIEGDYYNVVGFPLNRFYRELKRRMPDVFKNLFLN